jgi:hypothetical protein
LQAVPRLCRKPVYYVHFNSIDESLRANLIALKYKPSASELIDHYILPAPDNIEQSKTDFSYKATRRHPCD